MDVTFRTLGPWGPGKGANLQPSEVDNNFWSIAQAIISLENNPALPTSIASISVSGTQMTITLSDGTVFGPYTLPVLTFRWRGEWQPSTPYAVLDVFTVQDTGIYLTQIAHTSGTDFDPAIQQPPGSGQAALIQLFGSTNAALANLSDVSIVAIQDQQFLRYNAADQLWHNASLGDIAYQNSETVLITGGVITGMLTPVDPSDVATKGYVDGAVVGASALPTLTMLCNIGLATGPPTPQTLSDFIDASVGSTMVGQLLVRSGSGWVELMPGTSGQLLTSNGPGLDLSWDTPPIEGVSAISAGVGIDMGSSGGITGSGTVSLAALPDGDFLANISNTTAAPTPTTLTAFLDHVLGNARGTVLTRNISGWIALPPGTSGYYLKTQGAGADVTWDAPVGSGTVTSVAAGSGLTTGGSPITATGTVSLAAIADGTVLGNTSGASAVPVATTVSVLLDKALGTTQGAVMYRGATGWLALAPGTTGQILTTGGAAANPSWQNAPTSGASINNGQILSNIAGHTAVPVGNSLSAIFDAILSSSRGAIIFRTNSGWVALAPGTTGQVLSTGGAAGDPSWIAVATNLDGLSDVTVTSPQQYDQLVYGVTAGQWTRQRPKYNIGSYNPGVMAANQNLLFHRFSKGVTIPANFGGYLGHASEAGGGTAPINSTVITLARAAATTPATFTNVGTVTFAAGSLTPTFSVQAAIVFNQGDILRVRAPATADPAFADFHMTLIGFET